MRTGRDGVEAFSWGLADVIEQQIFRFLFADEDTGNANFGALAGAIEERLTRRRECTARAADGWRRRRSMLCSAWVKGVDKGDIGEPHPGTRASLVRRLRGLLQDSGGVLRVPTVMVSR